MEFVQKLIRLSTPWTQSVCLVQGPLQIFLSQGPLWFKCLSLKRRIVQSNVHRILWKVNEDIYIMYPNCMPDIMILAQAVGSSDILFKRLLYYTKCQNQKRDIIRPIICRILPKVNQVIYTFIYTICMANIMILAQRVLQIFCSQGPLWVKCRRIIQSNIERILWKVNQVIYIMYPNCMPDIMILAQAVLQIFCSQGCFTIQNVSLKREIIQSNIYRILPNVNQVIYTLDLYAKYHDPSSRGSPDILFTRSFMG